MTTTRLSVVSDEISQEPAVVARFVRDFKLPGFELRSMFGRAFKDLTPANVAEIRALVTGEGWRVHGCATPVFKCELDDEAAIQRDLEIFRRSLDVAKELQCSLVRVFTFLRKPEALSADTIERIAGHLVTLADLAASAGICVGIENENSCRVGSAAEMLQVGEKLTHPAIGWIWDPCNVLYVPGSTGPATAGFASVASRIVHIHVKDAVRTGRSDGPAAQSAPVGEGDVNWSRHLAEIHAAGYRGMLSLETHWRKLALDEKLLHLPAGQAFSAGGDEASRICMRRLIELCAAAG